MNSWRAIRLVFISFALLLTCTPVHAAFHSGTDLQQWVNAYKRVEALGSKASDADFRDTMKLLGFVAGVHDALEKTNFCTPAEVTVGQLLAIVKKYLADNPDKLHRNAVTLVIWAIEPAFPCKVQ